MDVDTPRPKRRRVAVEKRTEILDRLKALKGKKNKYDIDEVQNVYDVVDEEEYKNIVAGKAQSNWIEEDDGGEYFEDGREIFDQDDDDLEPLITEKKQKGNKRAKIDKTPNVDTKTPKLTGFFKKDLSAPVDKDKKSSVDSDNLLADLLRSVKEDERPASDNCKENKDTNVAKKDTTTVETLTIKPDEDNFDDELLSAVTAVENSEAASLKIPPVKKEVKPVALPKMAEFQTNKIELDNDVKEIKASDIKNEKSLNIFLWDIYEDAYKKPGQLFLFGKTEVNGNYSTVCIQVENVEKVVYLLPREKSLDTEEDVTIKDVYEEFTTTIAKELKIDSHRCKTVTKSFASFSEDTQVPKVSEYLMVRYNGDKPSPDPNRKYKTIAHIFGTHTSAIERFVIEKKVKGPSWITISDFVVKEVPATWCKLHIVCSNTNKIAVDTDCKLSPPPISLLALNIRVATNKYGKNEVVAISCLVNKKFHIDKPAPSPPFDQHFCVLGHPSDVSFPFDFKAKAQNYTETKIYTSENEISLLSLFLAKIQSIDPDIIITQDAYARQLDVLCDRLSERKVQMWSKIGRLKMSSYPTASSHAKVENYLIGRMVCDVKSSAQLLTHLKSYDLQNLCVEILDQQRDESCEIYTDDVPKMYESTDKLLNLVGYTMRDNLYSLNIMNKLNVLPLSLQLANITGNLMSYTLGSGRSKGVEFLLLHAFTEQNYLVPDKLKKENLKKVQKIQEDGQDVQDDGKTSNSKKARYAGGMVLEPIKGLYDKFVLLMDFNSLYPSIIQEFNICFTTIDSEDAQNSVSSEPGILPRQIKKLVENRRQVKKLLAQPDLSEELKLQYDIRQRALKLTANSMYGCLGAPNTRFYAPHLAALITQRGREILMNTKALVEKMQYTVVYGDTDSIMVLTSSTDYDQVFNIGLSIKQAVNKSYTHLELDIDGVFKYLLLLKKKKYAATLISRDHTGKLIEKQEHKGLDIVRRDWSAITQEVGRKVLNEIFSDKSTDERISNVHQLLRDVKIKFDNNEIDISLLEIKKQLTKALHEYNSNNKVSQPHVLVATRMNTNMNRNFKKGDTVSYVICLDGTEEAAIKRAYHIDEMKLNKNLKVDVEYYLAHQIHPVVTRLVEPIPETDSVRIAECLGLDPTKYRNAANQATKSSATTEFEANNTSAKKYQSCGQFTFTCQMCNFVNIVTSRSHNEIDKLRVFEKCLNKDCKAEPFKFKSAIENELIDTVRQHIARYYENWVTCDEPFCNENSRFYTHVSEQRKPICLFCGKGNMIRQYTETELYNQLFYYKLNFSQGLEATGVKHHRGVMELYTSLSQIINDFLARSAFSRVKLHQIYHGRYQNTTQQIEWNKYIENDD